MDGVNNCSVIKDVSRSRTVSCLASCYPLSLFADFSSGGRSEDGNGKKKI